MSEPDTTADEAVESSDPVPPEVPGNNLPGQEASPEKEQIEETDDDFLEEDKSPESVAALELIKNSTPSTELEKTLYAALERKDAHIAKITNEIIKLRSFVTKRKQTYKRKRKDEAAPTKALSAYSLYLKDRFAELAKQNENALKTEDSVAKLHRVAPSSVVAATGNEWKEMAAEEKSKYEERYVCLFSLLVLYSSYNSPSPNLHVTSAKEDRRRYEEQMLEYHGPDKQNNRKRNKTGYNMFFTAHVQQLKQTDSGVPSERGSVARIVGETWKTLSAEEKQFYEREADKHNDQNPMKEDDDDDEDGDDKRHPGMEHFPHMLPPHPDMHMVPPAHLPPPQHDPRHYYPPHMYGQPSYYDYSQHHQRHQMARGYQGRYPGFEP
jgi:hypothetical protein